MIENTVSRLCNTCPFMAFDCERKSWHPQKFQHEESLGKTCPMMQFSAKEDMDKRPFRERLLDRTLPKPLTVNDTVLVCEKCKYSKVIGDTIDIEQHYLDICIHCPNFISRESLEEAEAEARMS